MITIWSFIKKIFSEIRDFFWFYPYFFFDHSELVNSSSVWRWFMRARPFSIILSLFILLSALFMTLTDYGLAMVNHSNTIIEGLVKDPSFNGEVSVNPIVGSSNEIDKNLSKVIYETLFTVLPNGDITPLLALSSVTSADGKQITINLRQDVYWHDGVKFGADDVIETYRRLKNTGTENNIGSQTIQNTEITKLDDYSFQIVKKNEISNFLELINIGIMPKHILTKVTVNRLENHPINSEPVGTGPFKFVSSNEDRIYLIANSKYWGGRPKSEYYEFNLYDNEKEAVIALKSGQIHIFSNLSQNFIQDLEDNKNITLQKSIPIYRQYWALYFNLNKEGTVYKNLEVRQAVSLAINKVGLITSLADLGSVAQTTIPPISWVEPKSNASYDPTKATKLLNDNAWIFNEETNVRSKEGKILELNISYLDTEVKTIVAESIKNDLESIGIKVNLFPMSSSDMRETVVPNRDFDLLISGVDTSSDPDRIRFWHEQAITYPGLNLSGYISSVKVKDPITGARTSRVNDALERGLGSEDRTLRKDQYEALVRIIDSEVPAVFLYYPIMLSGVNKRIVNFDTSNITLPENRYKDIKNWEVRD